MKEKRCSKCKIIKIINEFHKNKSSKDNYSNWCKECNNKYAKEYYKNNPEKIKNWKQCNPNKNKEATRRWRKNNPEKFRAQRKIWRKNNIKKIKIQTKIWRINNSEFLKEWRNNNPQKIKLYKKRYYSTYRSNPKNRLNSNISGAIWKSLKGNKDYAPWEIIVGYTLKELIIHLTKLFKIGMNWNNYGRNGWHIDHIIPISLWEFNSYSDREFRQCWTLCNLQPLWAFENMSKCNRILNRGC